MNEYVNQAMAMMQKVIAAATPIAAKAWEISMLTLQIDALAMLIPFLMLIAGSVVLVISLRRFRAKELVRWQRACDAITAENEANKGQAYWRNNRYPDKLDYSTFDPMGLFFTWCAALSPGLVGSIGLCNVWLWVKLFMPELWLAHMAIEKLVK